MCLALFASSALAAPRPQRAGPDTGALVDTILLSLDGPIDAAIKAALGGSSVAAPAGRTNFQGTFTQVNKVIMTAC